ncbi:polysaccharide deacetylase family protein [Altererythrobacter sp. Root672]|uniref:polysaccharide deacetylase family protein n=1 Tax=Altererythrobacter sp. Root672 TaxID=1736584 RepID=UPI0006F47539|nr:polysaccharide deacetylase family protein [Altererythrobacter sp. Root672]KRA83734.1 WalW protein [Altererythrobacter sp. Root672]
MRSMIDPPSRPAYARFDPPFGCRFLLTVDTEEEFDWTKPLTRDQHGLDHVPELARFQRFCEAEGVVPVYLIDWPIAQSQQAAEILRAPLAAGKAELGIQLHPWVNPPFVEEVSQHNSFAGNLPPELEEAKFRALKEAIERNFAIEPTIYRAGRYGLGPNTAAMLNRHGIAVDTSVRSKFDYSAIGGANYGSHPLAPYWVDDERRLLELPLTTVHWGMLRRQGDWLQSTLAGSPALLGALAHTGMLERIPLTPEGVAVEEAIRGIDMALDDGLPLLVLSFHSPSLQPGHTPYVRDEADLENLYDWWRRVFAYLEQRKVAPTTVAEILTSVQR